MGKLHAPFRLFGLIRPISGAGRGSAQSDPDSRLGSEACRDFSPARTGTEVCKYCTTYRSPADCRPDRTGPMRKMLTKWWLCRAVLLFTGCCVGSVCSGSCYAKTWLYIGAQRLQVSTKVSRTEVEGSVRRRSVSDDLQRLTADDALKQIVAPPAPAGCGKCDVVQEPLKKVPKPDIMVPPTETTGCGQCIAPGLQKITPIQGLPRAPGL